MSYYADTVKSSVSMIDAAERYGLELDRAGFCPCPFHSEKTASFKCYDGDRGYYCFGCHAHGSVVDFVMQYFDMDFMQAIEKLNDDFGLNLPLNRRPTLRDKYAARSKPNRHLMERHQLEQAESEAEAAWIRADQTARALAPTSTDDISDDFAAALMEREKAGLRWRECEVKLYEFNQRNDSTGDAGTGDIS